MREDTLFRKEWKKIEQPPILHYCLFIKFSRLISGCRHERSVLDSC